jgi:hypothetical protein
MSTSRTSRGVGYFVMGRKLHRQRRNSVDAYQSEELSEHRTGRSTAKPS